MVEILWKIIMIVDRIRNMPINSNYILAFFGVLLVFGVTNCIFGYRLLRFWVMLAGFMLGAGVALIFMYSTGMYDKMQYLMGMLISGIVLGLLAFLIYKVGIFVLGAAIGLFLSIYILHPTTSAVFFVCMLAGVGLGSVGVKFCREVIIVATSLMGGLFAGVSLAKISVLEQIPYGVLMSLGFAVLGMVIQFAINKVPNDDDLQEIPETEADKAMTNRKGK